MCEEFSAILIALLIGHFVDLRAVSIYPMQVIHRLPAITTTTYKLGGLQGCLLLSNAAIPNHLSSPNTLHPTDRPLPLSSLPHSLI